MKIAVLGTDDRQNYVFKKLKNLNYDVDLISTKADLSGYGIIILPIPSVVSERYIFGFNNTMTAYDLKNSTDATVIGANVLKYGFTDILSRDDFKYLNAVPTAEAAISLAILNSKRTIWKSKVLITGFGHIGKMLYSRLKNFGADIDVTARSDRDLSLLECEGLTPIRTDELINHAEKYDYIFNTVFKPIFNENVIGKIKDDATVVELATANSGFDTNALINAKFNFISALGLPNKYSPITGGEIYLNTILKVINENI